MPQYYISNEFMKSNKRLKLQYLYLSGRKLPAIQIAKKSIGIHLIYKLDQNTISFFHSIVPKNSIRGHQPRAEHVRNRKSNQTATNHPSTTCTLNSDDSIAPMFSLNVVIMIIHNKSEFCIILLNKILQSLPFL